MAKRKTAQRIVREATPAEKQRHATVRKQIESELPELRKKGLLALHRHRLRQILEELIAARHQQGLSLADIRERTGMERSTISRLETSKDANPTLLTLQRYAGAVGRSVRISLDEPTVNTDKQGS